MVRIRSLQINSSKAKTADRESCVGFAVYGLFYVIVARWWRLSWTNHLIGFPLLDSSRLKAFVGVGHQMFDPLERI
jgi:hypothetical protein